MENFICEYANYMRTRNKGIKMDIYIKLKAYLILSF